MPKPKTALKSTVNAVKKRDQALKDKIKGIVEIQETLRLSKRRP